MRCLATKRPVRIVPRRKERTRDFQFPPAIQQFDPVHSITQAGTIALAKVIACDQSLLSRDGQSTNNYVAGRSKVKITSKMMLSN